LEILIDIPNGNNYIMNLDWYLNHFHFPNFNDKDVTTIRKQVENDIHSDYVLSKKTKEGFYKACQEAIYKLDCFRIITNDRFDSNSIWMNIHSLFLLDYP
jgi:hypothetical protein